MTTQESFETPPRSPTIVGSAVETIVWSSDASSSTIISAAKISRTFGTAAGGALTAASGTVASLTTRA